MYAIITILSLAAAFLLLAVLNLHKRLRKAEDEILNMRYVKVEKLPDGGWKLTDRTGKPFFEL